MLLRHKLILLSVLPLALTCMVFGVVLQWQSQKLAAQQATLVEENYLDSKRAELENYVELARSSLEPLYSATEDSASRQAEAKAILARLEYGEDGYFFALDTDGNNLVHPRQPELVGHNLLNVIDPQGRRFISQLLNAAMFGDGFLRYPWEKPSTRQMTEKLGHVVLLPHWQWVIGTGLYLDDMESATRQLRDRSTTNAWATMQRLSLAGLGLIAMVTVTSWALTASQQRLADKKLQLSMQRSSTLREDERARVACELHDGISQRLVGAKYHFEAAQQKLSNAGSQVDLDNGLEQLATAIDDVRLISQGLRASDLDRADQLGLVPAIRELMLRFGKRNAVAVELKNGAGDVPLARNQRDALFRIAQEALTNIERHAGAWHAQIELARSRKRLWLIVKDDGCGFDVNAVERSGHSGLGLWNIRYRIERIGGKFRVESAPGSQTVLSVSLPIETDRLVCTHLRGR